MANERRLKFHGEVIIGEGCITKDLIAEIFDCFKKYNAVSNLRIYELLPNEEEIKKNSVLKNMVEQIIEKRKNKGN